MRTACEQKRTTCEPIRAASDPKRAILANTPTLRVKLSAGAGLTPFVETDGEDDDDADDDLLHVIRPVALDGSAAENSHREGADHRSEDTAGSAIEAGATDDDCGDDVEFDADG